MQTFKLRKTVLAVAAVTPLSLALYSPTYAAEDKQAASQPQQQSGTMQQSGAAAGSQQSTTEGTAVVGETVYGAQGDEVGEVKNVLLTQDGEIAGVLVDVGGFLGVGAKTVVIKKDDVQWGERITAANLTKETAESMPEYQDPEEQRQQAEREAQRQARAPQQGSPSAPGQQK